MPHQPFSSLLQAVNRDISRPLNILCADTHERYQTELCKTGHNFYALQHPQFKRWDVTFAPIPANYYLLSGNSIEAQLDRCPTIDLVLSQNKFGQVQILSQIARMLGCPFISLEHTTPPPGHPDKYIKGLRSLRGDFDAFISEFNASQWQFDLADPRIRVVHHGVDTNLFCGWKGGEKILTVVNDYVNRDVFCGFKVWQQVTQNLPVHPVGATPGLSLPAKDVADLVRCYQECGVFLNTSIASPIPTSVLEAMAVGCPVVSTATCMLPEIIQDGVNGFCTNDLSMLRQHLVDVLGDPTLAKRIGAAARQTVLTRFSEEVFKENWNQLFQDAVDGPRLRWLTR